jgi:hypothetical protein
MVTFRVFGWDGLHARACYLWLRPVRVSPTLSKAFFAEPLAWSTRPSFLRCLSPVSAPAASFTRPFALSEFLSVVHVLAGWKAGGSVRV